MVSSSLNELAARRIRLPVVMTTAVGDESLAIQVLRPGASDYLPKDGDYLARLPQVLRNAIAEHRNEQEPQHAGERSRRRILYAEHDPVDVDLTLRHFAEVRPYFEVEVVESAAGALALLAEGGFDLVIADLRLPDMSALDLLREARHRGLQVPFLVITGGGDESAAVAALKLGAYDYIVKRANYLTHLPYVVDNAIARFQLTQQAAALAEAARQKDEFLAMLAQDDRTLDRALGGLGLGLTSSGGSPSCTAAPSKHTAKVPGPEASSSSDCRCISRPTCRPLRGRRSGCRRTRSGACSSRTMWMRRRCRSSLSGWKGTTCVSRSTAAAPSKRQPRSGPTRSCSTSDCRG